METKDLPGHYRHGGEVRGSRSAAPTKKSAASMLASMPAPRGYADGGVVQAIKGFFGAKKKPEPLPADLNKLPPTGAGPTPSQPKPKEEPKKAISQYNGMSALERRMKEQGLADGGMVRGPGTGTSDDVKDTVAEGTYIMPADSTKEIGSGALSKMAKVPVKLSNGEYKLTPEQVHAIGVQTLEGMKDATHKPARKAFADGGLVEDERAKVSQPVPGVQRQGNSYSATNVADRARQPAFSMGAGTYTPKPAAQPTPQATPSAQVVRDGGSVSAAPAVPRPAATQAPSASVAMAAMPNQQPAASAAPKPATIAQPAGGDRFMPGVRDVWNESGKAISDLAGQGRYGAAAGETARAALSYIPAVADDVLGGAYRAAAPAVGDALGQFFGVNGDSKPAAPTSAPASPSAQKPAATPAASPSATQTAPAPKPEPPKPNTPPTGAAAPTGAREIAPGIYRQGNSYGDSPEAAAAGARPGQGPSARNISAADVLASRSGQQPGQPADVMGIYARASEALKGVAEAQRALDDYGPRMSGGGDLLKGGRASAQQFQQDSLRTSLVQQAQQGGRGAAAAMQALNAMEGNQVNRDVAQMREQGDTTRFNAREAGETNRAGMRSAADARRDGLTAELGRGKLDLDRQAQGYANRSAGRLERLQSEYDAAKTPEERAAIAQKVRDLSGKESTTDWGVQVTPQTKNLDGSTTEGSVYRYNKRTGEVMRVDGGQAAQTTPKAGEVRGGYKFKGGNPADQNSWEKV